MIFNLNNNLRKSKICITIASFFHKKTVVILGLILNKIKKGFWLHLDEIYRPLFSFF